MNRAMSGLLVLATLVIAGATATPAAASGAPQERTALEHPSGDVDHPSEIIILETADSGDPD